VGKGHLVLLTALHRDDPVIRGGLLNTLTLLAALVKIAYPGGSIRQVFGSMEWSLELSLESSILEAKFLFHGMEVRESESGSN